MGWIFGGEEMNLFELSAKLGLDSSEYEAGISNAHSGLDTLEGAIKAFVAGYAVKKLVGLAKDAVTVGMQFDSAMSQVAATMGVTVDQIGELREFAKDMGATTAFSATQAAEALNYMALAGYDAEKSMKMLPTVLNLAAAGGFDLARASDMVTDAQSALGLSIEDTTVMVNQMAQTAARSNTNVEQLGDAMLTLGATGKFMAGGTDRLQTVLGLLADNGIKGSEAGTKLRNMLLKLSSPTKEGADLIERLGLEIFDAEGNMRDMQDIMLGLNEAMSTMTQEERMKALAELFNSRDLAAVNALLGTSKERWDELGTSIASAQGSAEKMANTQLGNLSGDITLLKSAAEGARIEFAEGITPSLRNVVKIITNALSRPRTQKYLKEVGEKIGNVVKIITEKALVVIPKLIDIGKDLWRSLKDNAVAIGAVVLAIKAIHSPIRTAITAVGLLIGAFGLMRASVVDVDEELANLSDSERELVENARNAASKFSEAREAFGEAFANIDTEMADVQSAWETLHGLVDENGKIAEGHEEEVQNLLEVINGALGTQYEINDGMITQYQEMVDTVDELIEKQWAQKLLEARSESYMLAKSQLEDAQKRLGIAKLEYEEKKKTLDEVRANKEALEETMRLQEATKKGYEDQLALLDEGTDAYEEMAAKINGVQIEYNKNASELKELEKSLRAATDAAGMQGDAMLGASAEVNALIAEIGRYDEAYSEFMRGNYAETKEILESDIAYRWKHVKKGQELTKEELEQLKRDYAIMYAVYKDYWAKLEAGQAGYNEKALEQLRQQMLDLGAILDDQLNIVNDKGKSIGENIGEGIISGIQSTQDRVNSTSSGLVNGALHAMTVTAQIASPSKRGRAIGKNIGGSVGIGMEDSYDSVIRSADDLSEGIFDALDTKPTQSYVKSGNGNGWGEMLSVLRDIRDNIGNEIVMQDGTLVGWMDKQLGKLAARKVRGTV